MDGHIIGSDLRSGEREEEGREEGGREMEMIDRMNRDGRSNDCFHPHSEHHHCCNEEMGRKGEGEGGGGGGERDEEWLHLSSTGGIRYSHFATQF